MRLCAFFLLPALLCGLALSSPCLAQVATVLPSEAPAGLGLGTVYSYTLENGLRVLVAPSDANDLVTLDAWMDAGSRRETDDNNGAAHFIEHLLFRGTPTRKPGEIDEQIENLGGTLNAATSYDWAHFYVTVASADAPAALTILSDALMHASISETDMDAERPVILSEIAADYSTPDDQLTRVYNALEYPDHPYGRPIVGTPDTVANMTRATVYAFYKTFYAPADATLVISGHVTPEQGLEMARTALGGWPSRPVPPDNAISEVPQTQTISTNLTGPSPDAHLIIGFHAPSVRQQPDSWIMDVLLTYLGQGGNNILQQDLQYKQHLVADIGADYLTQRDPGSLTVTADCAPSAVSQVVKDILSDIEALRDTPLTSDQLAEAKHALLASYLFDAQTTSGRADALGFYSVIDDPSYDTDYIQHFENVTAAQVQQVAQKYLDPTKYTLVTMLPQPSAITASAVR